MDRENCNYPDGMRKTTKKKNFSQNSQSPGQYFELEHCKHKAVLMTQLQYKHLPPTPPKIIFLERNLYKCKTNSGEQSCQELKPRYEYNKTNFFKQ
jgi:hypothetical protein